MLGIFARASPRNKNDELNIRNHETSSKVIKLKRMVESSCMDPYMNALIDVVNIYFNLNYEHYGLKSFNQFHNAWSMFGPK